MSGGQLPITDFGYRRTDIRCSVGRSRAEIGKADGLAIDRGNVDCDIGDDTVRTVGTFDDDRWNVVGNSIGDRCRVIGTSVGDRWKVA